MSKEITVRELASKIDHTLLRPDALLSDIDKLCREAAIHQFASVCVNPCHVPAARKILEGSGVEVCTVVGFPLGANPVEIKRKEALWCRERGASEIDMVMNIGWLKSHELLGVEEDIRAVVEASDEYKVKVILECCYLTKEEIVKACRIVKAAGAHFVKTSTGFGPGGATLEDVKLMKETVPDLKVKAAGGIRDLRTVLAMLEAGADRIGASASLKILEELES